MHKWQKKIVHTILNVNSIDAFWWPSYHASLPFAVCEIDCYWLSFWSFMQIWNLENELHNNKRNRGLVLMQFYQNPVKHWIEFIMAFFSILKPVAHVLQYHTYYFLKQLIWLLLLRCCYHLFYASRWPFIKMPKNLNAKLLLYFWNRASNSNTH